jgi:arylsulfatase
MSQPNILLILTDQQRGDTIGALGNSVIKTPHLDRLVREGTAYMSAYTPAPECVPARACLTFGQYPSRLRCYNNSWPMPWKSKDTIMTALTRAGYHTHAVGKCHFTPNPYELHGFASRETQEELVDDPTPDDYLQFLWSHGGRHITDPHGVRSEMYYVPQPAQMPAASHPTQWIGDRSVAFLRKRGAKAQPWYLFSSFIHPHPPFCPPAPWHKLYRDIDVPLPHLPAKSRQLLLYINHFQNRYKRRDRGYDLQLVRMMRAYYYACLSFIDFQIGRMLATLEETGQLDNTLILFSSDHGELLGDFYSFGKRSYHDAASRIPLLARLPGMFPAGKRCETPASLVDVTATQLAVAGASFRTHQPDGANLAEIGDRDRTVFSQLNYAGDAIYTAVNRRWKYVYSAPDQCELAFDRQRDPGETKNIRVPVTLRTALLEFLRETGETAAVTGKGWRRYRKKQISLDPDAGHIYQDHAWADQRIPGYSDEKAE